MTRPMMDINFMMINLKQYLISIKEKIDINSVKLGIVKGYKISTLPNKIEIYYSHPLIRIFRIIGGFCAVLVWTNNYSSFPDPLKYITLYIAIIQLSQIMIITIIRIIYSIRKMIKSPEDFEIRNSPSFNIYRLNNLREINSWKKLIFNIFSVCFVLGIVYLFVIDLNFEGLFNLTNIISYIITFSVSALLSNFILNHFKYSEYLIIRILQIIIIYIILFSIISLVFGIIVYSEPGDDYDNGNGNNLNEDNDDNNNNNNVNKNTEIASVNTINEDDKDKYIFKMNKDIADKMLDNTKELIKVGVTEMAPNLGAAAAATIKATAGLPLTQRVALVAGSALVTAAFTKVGLGIGSTILRNNAELSRIKTEVAEENLDKSIATDDEIPSPDSSMINYVLEWSESSDISPLEELLKWQFLLNELIILILILILFTIFNKYIVKYILISIKYLINKLHKYLLFNSVVRMFSNALNKHNVLAFDFNHKLMLILMIWNSIVLVYCLYLNICISIELNNNIDAYVTVYNNIHTNSL